MKGTRRAHRAHAAGHCAASRHYMWYVACPGTARADGPGRAGLSAFKLFRFLKVVVRRLNAKANGCHRRAVFMVIRSEQRLQHPHSGELLRRCTGPLGPDRQPTLMGPAPGADSAARTRRPSWSRFVSMVFNSLFCRAREGVMTSSGSVIGPVGARCHASVGEFRRRRRASCAAGTWPPWRRRRIGVAFRR